MKQSMHNNESIPVTITRVKENRKIVKKGKKKFCVDTMKIDLALLTRVNQNLTYEDNCLIFKDAYKFIRRSK
jgi:hypothetical protein